ncbi:MAG TPA: surface-adhesin E family protein [Casimicrobiaceae bacterium]|nr:surface-adhesin E family protein [Casimicrobiaceae bacterium]
MTALRDETRYAGDTGLLRTVLSTVMMLAAASAWADWVKVVEVGDTVYDVDSASIGKAVSRRASVLYEYAKQESGGVRSRLVTYEIDCSGERLRSLSVTEYSEPMAQGKSVNSWESESVWLYAAPKTGSHIPARAPYRQIVRFVCTR